MGAPYAGNPTNFPAAITELAGDAPTETNFNTPIEGLADRTAWLRGRTALPANNWQKPFPIDNLAPLINSGSPPELKGSVVVASWNGQNLLVGVNTTTEAWVLSTTGDAEGDINTSTDTGAGSSWGVWGGGAAYPGVSSGLQIGSVLAQLTGANAGLVWVAAIQGTPGTPGLILQKNPPLGSWASGRTTIAGTFTDVKLARLGDYIIYAAGSASTGLVKISSSPDGGTTWNDFAVGQAITSWRIQGNDLPIGSGGLAIAIFPSTLSAHYWTSPDAVTWTVRAFSFLGAHDYPVNVVWDPTRSLWFLATNTNISAIPLLKFYSSPDGIIWTLLGTGTAPNGLILTDFDTFAGDFVGSFEQLNTASGGPSFLIFSLDGCITWYSAQAKMPSNTALADSGYRTYRFATSSLGALFFNGKWLRFTSFVGLPPALT